MSNRAKHAVVSIPVLAMALISAARAADEHVSFVTCPIFRDAVNQCWLAEHRGRVYYIGRVGQEQPPELLHRALVQGTVKAGETIVFQAAAGGVGQIGCQWAKHLGATVIGSTTSPGKVELAKANGCAHVINTKDAGWEKQVRELTGGKGVPVVYDSVGRVTFESSLKCLRPRGILASFGESSGDPPPVSVRQLGNMGSLFVTHPSLIDYTATRADLLETTSDLFAMVASGEIKLSPNSSLWRTAP